MDLLQVAKLIHQKIQAIEEQRNTLHQLAREKATTESKYDKALCITLIRLKQGAELEIDTHKIQHPPVSIMDKIAKGYCWKEKLDRDTAEGLYKATVSNISALESQMTGFQSINKFLREIEK